MSWFYLALLAPLLYAVVNLFDDNLLQFVYKSSYLATAFAGLFGALPALAIIVKAPHLSAHLAVIALLSGFLTLCYYYFYFEGLASDSPSIVIALFSLVPALLPVLAHIFVHEHLTGLELGGFLIVLLASLSLAATDIRKLNFSAALLPVCIAVVFMDAGALLSKYAYDNSSFYSVYMYFALGMGAGGLMFLGLKMSDNKKQLARIKKRLIKLLPIFIVSQAIGVGAEITLNLAISRGSVSLVKVIEGIQPMFVLAIAVALYPLAPRFFREAADKQLTRKFALMGIAVAGLGLISFAVRG